MCMIYVARHQEQISRYYSYEYRFAVIGCVLIKMIAESAMRFHFRLKYDPMNFSIIVFVWQEKDVPRKTGTGLSVLLYGWEKR